MKTCYRKKLRHLIGQRMAFSAQISRYGKKSAFRGEPVDTILLVDICRVDIGEAVTDHLWFTAGKSWAGWRQSHF